MRRMNRLVLVFALIALAAAGCSRVFKQPEVALSTVRLGGIGLRGGLVYVELSVDNPNSYSLEAERLTYDLDLQDSGASGGWVKLAQGTFDKEMKVPGHGSAKIEIPIEFQYSGAGSAIKSVLDKGTLNYRVTGSVGVTEPISRTVPFSRTGVVSLAGVR